MPVIFMVDRFRSVARGLCCGCGPVGASRQQGRTGRQRRLGHNPVRHSTCGSRHLWPARAADDRSTSGAGNRLSCTAFSRHLGAWRDWSARRQLNPVVACQPTTVKVYDQNLVLSIRIISIRHNLACSKNVRSVARCGRLTCVNAWDARHC